MLTATYKTLFNISSVGGLHTNHKFFKSIWKHVIVNQYFKGIYKVAVILSKIIEKPSFESDPYCECTRLSATLKTLNP